MRIRAGLVFTMFAGLVVTAVTTAPRAGADRSCNPKNSVGYVSQERYEVCGDRIECATRSQLCRRRSESVRGDLICHAAMEEAVKRSTATRRRIQRWTILESPARCAGA
jgi:hypothetical protein